MVLLENFNSRLLPNEVQFLAENEMIEILPRQAMNSVNLVGVCIITDFDSKKTAFLIKDEDQCT